MSDLDRRGRRMKLAGLVIVGLGSLFFLAMGVGEMASGDLSGFQHLPPAALFGVLVYLGRRHPYAVGIVLVIIALGLASLYAAGFIGSDEPVGTRIAWALQVALPPLVAGALLIGAARREGGGPRQEPGARHTSGLRRLWGESVRRLESPRTACPSALPGRRRRLP